MARTRRVQLALYPAGDDLPLFAGPVETGLDRDNARRAEALAEAARASVARGTEPRISYANLVFPIDIVNS